MVDGEAQIVFKRPDQTFEDVFADTEIPGDETVQTVTARQIRLGLLQIGMLDAAEAWVATADAAARVEWEYATEVRRAHPMWAAAAAALGKTEAEIDALFALAATL